MKTIPTKHLREDRVGRYAAIATTIGFGEIIATFPRANEKGPTIHILTSTGVIFVKSARTEQMITCWVASPSQIYKYYENTRPPIALIQKARKNQQKGYCKMN